MNTQPQLTTTDGPAGSLALDPRSALKRFRAGQKVFVKFEAPQAGKGEEYTGHARFKMHLTDKNCSGWAYACRVEPHCLVKTTADDTGSCFPLSAVFLPNK